METPSSTASMVMLLKYAAADQGSPQGSPTHKKIATPEASKVIFSKSTYIRHFSKPGHFQNQSTL
jgi:hypothetical protein